MAGLDLEFYTRCIFLAQERTPSGFCVLCGPGQLAERIFYRCSPHSGEKPATIGRPFGISDTAVSQARKAFKTCIDLDWKLGEHIAAIERKRSRVEAWP